MGRKDQGQTEMQGAAGKPDMPSGGGTVGRSDDGERGVRERGVRPTRDEVGATVQGAGAAGGPADGETDVQGPGVPHAAQGTGVSDGEVGKRGEDGEGGE